MLALLAWFGGYNFWLSRQALDEQQIITGVARSLVRNPVRRRSPSIHYELLIQLKDRPEIFRVPVRYEPAIPDIIENVRPGDSITVVCPVHTMPSVRTSIEIVHLVHKGNVLLDFQKVRAFSRCIATICAIGIGVNLILLSLAYRKKQIRRFFKSRRFFA
jgi:hypothetical protein